MESTVIVRASSLNGYPDCPRRSAAGSFREEILAAGYTLRETPKNIGAIIGTAMHEGAAFSLMQKKEKGEAGSDGEANDIALAKLEDEMHEDMLFDPATLSKDDAVKQTRSLLKACREHVVPTITPVMVEKRLEARIGNIILSGQADVTVEDGIGDWKSGRLKRHHINQIGAYALLARSHGANASKATEYYIKRVKADVEQPLPEISNYDVATAESSALSVIRHINRDLENFRETGERWAFLANPSSMLCSEKYCKAWGTNFCREHKK